MNYTNQVAVKSLIESSESDISEDNILMIENIFHSNTSSNQSSSSDCDNNEHACIENFLDIIQKYSDKDFKTHFRLERSTVIYLIDQYAVSEFLPDDSHGRRSRIGCEKEIYMYLWYISNSITFRQLGNLFGVTKSSAWTVVRRVCHWIISIGHLYVKWPEPHEYSIISQKFERKRKIPGIIGAIDCSHIVIKAPIEHKQSYFDRKHQYSIVLQAVVDADKKFIDICVGEPGSLHDSRVLRRSDLYRRANTNPELIFHENSFIIGDSAYPSSNWIVPPFKDNGHLTDSQKRFNFLHSSSRMVVENAFGLLKNRFRRLLHFTEQQNLCLVSNLVLSACILHNICIIFDDQVEDEFDDSDVDDDNNDDDDDTTIYNNSNDRRQILFNHLIQSNILN